MIATTNTPHSSVSTVGPKRDYISYSSISAYQRCPLFYQFKYEDGRPETVANSSLIFRRCDPLSTGISLQRIAVWKRTTVA